MMVSEIRAGGGPKFSDITWQRGKINLQCHQGIFACKIYHMYYHHSTPKEPSSPKCGPLFVPLLMSYKCLESFIQSLQVPGFLDSPDDTRGPHFPSLSAPACEAAQFI